MVEDKNSSNNDVAYKAIDAAFLEAAYVNVAWAHEVQQSPEIIAAAQNLVEQYPIEKTITADDIADIAATVKQNCMLAGVPMAEIEKILASINSNVGAPKSRLDEVSKTALAEANNAIATAKGDVVQNTMYNDAQYQQLWNEIKAIDKKIDKNIDELHAEGLISDEEYLKLKKERAQLDAMDINDPKRIAGEKLYGQHLRTIYDRADGEVTTDKQQEIVDRGIKLVDKRDELVDEAAKAREARTQPGNNYAVTAPAAKQDMAVPVVGNADAGKNVPPQSNDVLISSQLTSEIASVGATLKNMQMAQASVPEALVTTPAGAPAKTLRSMD